MSLVRRKIYKIFLSISVISASVMKLSLFHTDVDMHTDYSGQGVDQLAQVYFNTCPVYS